MPALPLAGERSAALLLVFQEPFRAQVGRLVEAEPTIARRLEFLMWLGQPRSVPSRLQLEGIAQHRLQDRRVKITQEGVIAHSPSARCPF